MIIIINNNQHKHILFISAYAAIPPSSLVAEHSGSVDSDSDKQRRWFAAAVVVYSLVDDVCYVPDHKATLTSPRH